MIIIEIASTCSDSEIRLTQKFSKPKFLQEKKISGKNQQKSFSPQKILRLDFDVIQRIGLEFE